MIRLGDYNELEILRSTRVGLFLGDGEETEILLPNKYVPATYEIGEAIHVFCYLDHEDRPVSTTLRPLIVRDGFARLDVAEVNSYGAFLNWGLEKHLLVPFREQLVEMKPGDSYLVHCYLDDVTSRLVASSRLDRFLSNEDLDFKERDEVSLIIARKTSLGWEVIINGISKGLLFSSDVFQELYPGKQLSGFIKKIRPDKKVDVTLQPEGAKMLEPTARNILELLEKSDGQLPLHDKSPPEEIQRILKISKKAFKKAIGVLYKERKISIESDGIVLKKTK